MIYVFVYKNLCSAGRVSNFSRAVVRRSRHWRWRGRRRWRRSWRWRCLKCRLAVGCACAWSADGAVWLSFLVLVQFLPATSDTEKCENNPYDDDNRRQKTTRNEQLNKREQETTKNKSNFHTNKQQFLDLADWRRQTRRMRNKRTHCNTQAGTTNWTHTHTYWYPYTHNQLTYIYSAYIYIKKKDFWVWLRRDVDDAK